VSFGLLRDKLIRDEIEDIIRKHGPIRRSDITNRLDARRNWSGTYDDLVEDTITSLIEMEYDGEVRWHDRLGGWVLT